MAVINARRVESADTSFDRKQIVRVPGGLYGGMFARYTLPKSYPKFQSEEEEEKFFAWFTLTHDRANQQLPHFSEAMMTVRPKLFFDPKNGMKSAYVALLYALLGGKVPCEQIVDQGSYDLDEYIGRPAILFVEQHPKPDKNGLYSHKIKSLESADKGLVAAIKPLYAAKKIEKSEGGVAHLSYPVTAYAEDVTDTTGDDSLDDLTDEIPL